MLHTAYKTGNKKLDQKIEAALAKSGVKLDATAKEGLKQEFFKEISGQNKYGVSRKEDRTYSDGFVFASKKEMERWDYLLKLQMAGEIKDLQRQVPFTLLEGYISKQKEWGEIRPLVYVADFVYTNISYRKGYEGRVVVEDSKTGMRTPEYRIKKKIFLFVYGSYLFYEV